jgi:hypothetical protein
MQALYYTSTDRLIDVKASTVEEATRAEMLGKIRAIQSGISGARVPKTAADKDRLEHEAKLIQEQIDAIIFTPGCSNKIEHRELTPLTKKQCEVLINGPAGEAIQSCRKKFNTISVNRVSPEQLSSGNEVLDAPEMSPFYNYGMSIEQTFARVRDRRITTTGGFETSKRFFDPLRIDLESNRTDLSSAMDRNNPEDIKKASTRLAEIAKNFSEQCKGASETVSAMSKKPARIWKLPED